MATTLTLNVNNANYTVTVNDTNMPLLWVLRDLIGLTGTKYGCGIEVCGACTVMIDGQREHSCVFNVSSAVGRKITTIEGLSPDRSHPAQQSWIATSTCWPRSLDIRSHSATVMLCAIITEAALYAWRPWPPIGVSFGSAYPPTPICPPTARCAGSFMT